MEKLKYLTSMVVFQEIPNEITLAINVSGCPYRCKGCHSPELWEYSGEYVSEDLDRLIKQNDGITCVCFMGGDQNPLELVQLGERVRALGLKVGLYTGTDNYWFLTTGFSNFDYIKYGRWREDDGPLSSPTTNQRLIQNINGEWKDITFSFLNTGGI